MTRNCAAECRRRHWRLPLPAVVAVGLVLMMSLAACGGTRTGQPVFEQMQGDGWEILSTEQTFQGFVTTERGLETLLVRTDLDPLLGEFDPDRQVLVGTELWTSGGCPNAVVHGIDVSGAEVVLDVTRDDGWLFRTCDDSAAIWPLLVAFDKDAVPQQFTFLGRDVDLDPKAERRQYFMAPSVQVTVRVNDDGGLQPVVRNLWYEWRTSEALLAKTYLIREGQTEAGGIYDGYRMEVLGFIADCSDTASCKAAFESVPSCHWSPPHRRYRTFEVTVIFDYPTCSIEVVRPSG